MSFSLVLGGGAARGFAHIGVLRFLAERSEKPTEIIGCSMGALIGAMAAMGKSADEIEKIATKSPIFQFAFDFSPKSGGLLSGKRLDDFLDFICEKRKIEELPIPFCCVATDLETGDEIIFRSGLLSDALRATIAVPGVFAPARINDRFLVDGGLVANLPVHLTTHESILAVSVRRPLKPSLKIRENDEKKRHRAIPTLIDALEQTVSILLRERELSAMTPKIGKTVIELTLPNISYWDFSHPQKIATMGYEETKGALAKWQP